MDEVNRRELLEVVRAAKEEVEVEVGDYRRLIDQLGELEEGLREGCLAPELVQATQNTMLQFPGLTRPGTRAASRPDVRAERESNLIQLKNKLKEL